jgi:hypothetical protein
VTALRLLLAALRHVVAQVVEPELVVRGVTPGEIVVDGHEVDALTEQRVEVRRERRDEGLALARLHLRDPSEVQRGPAHQLHVEVTLAEHPLARLADRRERLGEEVVERVDPGLALGHRITGAIETSPELGGERAELLVAAALHLGLEGADVGHERLEELELAAFAGVEELLEDAHDGGQPTGAPRGV